MNKVLQKTTMVLEVKRRVTNNRNQTTTTIADMTAGQYVLLIFSTETYLVAIRCVGDGSILVAKLQRQQYVPKQHTLY